MTSEQELLPCPFCRGEASLEYDEMAEQFSSNCVNCGIQLDGPSKAEAIAAWNTRATLPTPTAFADLIERFERWCQNIGFDGGPESPPMRTLQALRTLAAENERMREARAAARPPRECCLQAERDALERAAKVAEMHDHRGDIAAAIRALIKGSCSPG